MSTSPRKTPPLLPSKRARAQALQAAVRAALSLPSSRGYLLPRSVDTTTIDAAWPVAPAVPSPLVTLAGLVRARRSGRAFPPQTNVRAEVVRLMERADVRMLRIGDVTLKLGVDQIVGGGDLRELRSGALRVLLAKPARAPKGPGVNLPRVREVLREAVGTGSPVANLADWRARKAG